MIVAIIRGFPPKTLPLQSHASVTFGPGSVQPLHPDMAKTRHGYHYVALEERSTMTPLHLL